MEYFISYAWSNSTGSGFGNVDIRIDVPIRNSSDIKDIRELIAKNMGQDTTITILNYIEFPVNNPTFRNSRRV